MAKSSLERRVKAVEEKREREFVRKIENRLSHIETNPVDLALQICVLHTLKISFPPDELPLYIANQKAKFEHYIEAMDESDRSHVMWIVEEYLAAVKANRQESIRAVSEKFDQNINSNNQGEQLSFDRPTARSGKTSSYWHSVEN